MRKCRLFIIGIPHLDLVVDHRLLVPIINRKNLYEIENPRLQRLREKILFRVRTATASTQGDGSDETILATQTHCHLADGPSNKPTTWDSPPPTSQRKKSHSLNETLGSAAEPLRAPWCRERQLGLRSSWWWLRLRRRSVGV